MKQVSSEERDASVFAEALNIISRKRTDVVTLTPNATSTEVLLTRHQCNEDSVILLDPLNATAAAELATGGVYIDEADRFKGRFIITHVSDPGADRRFRYIIQGY